MDYNWEAYARFTIVIFLAFAAGYYYMKSRLLTRENKLLGKSLENYRKYVPLNMYDTQRDRDKERISSQFFMRPSNIHMPSSDMDSNRPP